MKKHNKFLILLTVFVLIFNSSTLCTSAEESATYITIEEFQSMMNELYSRYSSSFTILDDNDLEYISIEYAERMYQNASIALEETTTRNAMQLEAANMLTTRNWQEIPAKNRAIMSVFYADSDIFTVSASAVPFAYANFKLELYGTVNAQYNSFITLDYSGIYQSGLSCNYDGFDIISESTYYSNNNTSYTVYANMDVYFSWIDPTFGLKFGETVCHCYMRTFKSVDGME